MNEPNERIVLVVERIVKNTDPKVSATKSSKFRTADHLRTSKYNVTFAKGYALNWINEIFTVLQVQYNVTVTYLLKGHTEEC